MSVSITSRYSVVKIYTRFVTDEEHVLKIEASRLNVTLFDEAVFRLSGSEDPEIVTLCKTCCPHEFSLHLPGKSLERLCREGL